MACGTTRYDQSVFSQNAFAQFPDDKSTRLAVAAMFEARHVVPSRYLPPSNTQQWAHFNLI